MEERIREMVHHFYYDHDYNCARTTMLCLGELFELPIDESLFLAAAGMHGAGGRGDQCGLVEGGLLYIAFYFGRQGLSEARIVDFCHEYGDRFCERFSSLLCREIRPWGFNADDEPHMCEKISAGAILFTYAFIREKNERIERGENK